MTLYVHFLASNAEREYDFSSDLKGNIYTQYKLNALKKQKTQFKNRARQSFSSSKSQDLTQFLHETHYGDKIAEQLNSAIGMGFHGFTSSAEFAPGTSFSSFSYLSEEEVKKALDKLIAKNSSVISDAANILKNWSNDIDGLIANLGQYILNLLTKEEQMTEQEKQMVQSYLNLSNNSIIEIPASASMQAKVAMQDYNRLIEDNNLLLAKAAALSSHGTQGATPGLAKEFQGLGRFLNVFGGFIGEVASLLGLYKAISDPKLKKELGKIEDIFHTGAQKSMGKFIATSVTIKNDPDFQKFLTESSKLGTQQTLKEDVNFILSNDYVTGLVGVNIKNSSEIKPGVVTKNKYITLDSSGTFAQVINRVTNQGIVPSKFGNPDYYYNLAAGVPYRKKGEPGAENARNLTSIWNNYVDLIATGNLLVALMGRMNEMGASVGDNALIFLLNGKYYGIHAIIEKIIQQIEGNKKNTLWIKGHQDKGSQALHRTTLSSYNYAAFQKAAEKTSSSYEAAAQKRSQLVNTYLTYAFQTTMKTKIKIDLFSLL